MFPDRIPAIDGAVFATFVGGFPEASVRRAGRSFLNVLEKMKNVKEWLGVILAHRYTETGIQPENLKGIDHALYSLVTGESKRQVALLPVLIHENWLWFKAWEVDQECQIPDDDAATVFAFTPSDIAYFSHSSTTLEPLPIPTNVDVRFVQLSFGMGLYFKRYPNEDAGNDVEPGNADGLYMASALLIGPNLT